MSALRPDLAVIAAHVAPISDQVTVHHADVGPTGPWGVPVKSRFYPQFLIQRDTSAG